MKELLTRIHLTDDPMLTVNGEPYHPVDPQTLQEVVEYNAMTRTLSLLRAGVVMHNTMGTSDKIWGAYISEHYPHQRVRVFWGRRGAAYQSTEYTYNKFFKKAEEKSHKGYMIVEPTVYFIDLEKVANLYHFTLPRVRDVLRVDPTEPKPSRNPILEEVFTIRVPKYTDSNEVYWCGDSNGNKVMSVGLKGLRTVVQYAHHFGHRLNWQENRPIQNVADAS